MPLPSDLDRFFSAVRVLSSTANTGSKSSPEELFREALSFRRQIHQERANTAKRFNVFRVLGITTDELRHSRFLAHLLDPRADHDRGMPLLESFLAKIGLQSFMSTDVTAENISVWTEWTIPAGRIDIAIFLGRSGVVLVENKIWAPEQDNQIDRYQRWMTDLGPETSNKAIVFLTPDGRAPRTAAANVASDSVPVLLLSHKDIARWLDGFKHEVPPPLGGVLAMYSSLCCQLP